MLSMLFAKAIMGASVIALHYNMLKTDNDIAFAGLLSVLAAMVCVVCYIVILHQWLNK